MGVKLSFNDLLRKIEIDPSEVMLIRHTAKGLQNDLENADTKEIVKDWDDYTRHQGRDNFDRKYWAVFINNDGGTTARFFKLYENNFENRRILDNDRAFYDLTPMEDLEDYENRLVIDWGKSAIAWHQFAENNDKEILAMRDEDSFVGYAECKDIPFNTLRGYFAEPERYKDWVRAFENTKAIYLITDKTGKRYVGSAYGKNGLKSRWLGYTETGHNGNKLMEKAMNTENLKTENMYFTILEILSPALTDEEIIQRESFWKDILMTRAKYAGGLNAN